MYQDGFKEWGKPVAYQLLDDAGFKVYSQTLAIRPDDKAKLAPCLKQIVPVFQQAAIDYQLTELICPRCRQPLNQVRTAHGVFWGCPNCGGRAVNIELLRRTFTPESINPLWLHAIRNEGKSSCACPSCKNPMIEVALSDQAGVNVDVCRPCHFIWFDVREVENLVPRPVPPAPPEVPQKVREIIAIERVKQLAEQARGPDFDSVAPDERWKWIAAFLGMPVEFDAAPQERRPWATWILSATIIVASVFAFTRLHEIVSQFGLIPAQATRLHGLTFLTSFFLHAGVIHLIGNMYSFSCSAMTWRIS